MSFKFEQLVIWQKAMNLGEEINLLAELFPKKEMFNLSSQVCRAVDSVALNISEGAILQSKAENAKFLSYAIRSLAETVCCLIKAQRRLYITESKFNTLYNEAFNLMNMIIGYRKKVIA